MNNSNNDYKPILSKHELILERYKVMLESNDKMTANSGTSLKNSNNMIKSINLSEKASDSKVELMNKMIENSKFTMKSKTLINIQDSSLKDNIEAIRSKYLQNLNRPHISQISGNQITSSSSVSASLANKYQNFDAFNLNNILSQSTNPDIELIKMKYRGGNNNSIPEKIGIGSKNQTGNNLPSMETNIGQTINSVLEEKLAKYKKCNKEEVIESFVSMNNNNNLENGQSIQNKEKFETNNQIQNDKESVNEQSNNLMLSRISLIEEKLNLLQSQNTPNEFTAKQNKEIVTKMEQAVDGKLKTKENIISINENISKLKEKKNKNKLMFGQANQQNLENKDNLSFSSNTGDLLNSIMGEVINKLFTQKQKQKNENQINKQANENEITFMPKAKTKIFKLRASSAPKKKITTFEEFIENENLNESNANSEK